MKYRVLTDYGSEGLRLSKKEYDSVNEAVKETIALNSCDPFQIITVVDWEAQLKVGE